MHLNHTVVMIIMKKVTFRWLLHCGTQARFCKTLKNQWKYCIFDTKMQFSHVATSAPPPPPTFFWGGPPPWFYIVFSSWFFLHFGKDFLTILDTLWGIIFNNNLRNDGSSAAWRGLTKMVPEKTGVWEPFKPWKLAPRAGGSTIL